MTYKDEPADHNESLHSDGTGTPSKLTPTDAESLSHDEAATYEAPSSYEVSPGTNEPSPNSWDLHTEGDPSGQSPNPQTSTQEYTTMDSSKASPDTTLKPSGTGEMEIDLGYAEYTDAYSEAEELDELDPLEDLEDSDTPILTERVEDDLHNQNIAKLEAIVFGEEAQVEPAPEPEEEPEPHTQAPAQSTIEPRDPPVSTASPQESPEDPPAKANPIGNAPSLQLHPAAPLTAKGENPFLPKHIMDRLNQGRNLVEEIAQSSAALDASTAILRTHARAERMNKPVYGESQRHNSHNSSASKNERQRQALIDDLIEEYLPLIAAELRRRLNRMVD